MDQKSFEEYARTEMENLTKENAEIDEKIGPLLATKEINVKKIEHLQGYLTVSGAPIDEPNSIRPVGESEAARKFFEQRKTQRRTVEAMAIQVLERHQKPLHYAKIAELIESEEGYKIGGKNPKATMSAHISNSKKIIGVGDGYYTLKDGRTVNPRIAA